jgi:hypothetical protein
MSDNIPYAVGAEVSCTDGDCGHLIRVIVDPAALTLAHLVVGTKRGTHRLVPAALVESATPERIRLACEMERYNRFEAAQVTEFLPPVQSQANYPGGQGYSMPGRGSRPQSVTYDRVPDGAAEVRPDEPVHTPDGDVGRVRGIVADSDDNHLTYVLLNEGRLWSRKDVAIPFRAVTKVGGGIHVSLTKDQVKELPPVRMESLV